MSSHRFSEFVLRISCSQALINTTLDDLVKPRPKFEDKEVQVCICVTCCAPEALLPVPKSKGWTAPTGPRMLANGRQFGNEWTAH